MANTFINATAVAQAALAHLYNNTVLLPLTWRDFEKEFVPGRGATINIRKPATFTAAAYNGSTITIQNATETSVPMTLDKHMDVSFAVTSADMTLKIEDFSAQLLAPALEAHAQKIDKDIIGALDAGGLGSVGGSGDLSEPWYDPKVLIDARTYLSERAVPLTDRYAVAGPRMAGEWLKSDQWMRVDASGDSEALRNASMGLRKAGFEPVESQNITTNAGYAFHKTAIAFASRPLALPRGAADAAILDYKGVGLRVVFGYDMQLKSDVCSVDVLYGVKVLDAARAVMIDGTSSS